MNNLFQTERLEYSAQHFSKRLDLYLTETFPGHSRAYFQYLIESGAVRVNGNCVKKRTFLKESDSVEISFLFPEQLSITPENIPLDILYEDEEIIVINKQADLVIHPAPGNPKGTLINALLYHCKNLPESDPLRPGIVHRLDKGTTGVLIAAKTLSAHRSLVHQFSKRLVLKHYLAITTATPPEGLCTARIMRHPIKRKEMTVLSEGKEAHTEIKVLSRSKELAYVSLNLKTGRTHQARVHLKYLKAPILGDPLYGVVHHKATRPLLHAHSLQVFHPLSGNPLEFVAPVPEDMKTFIDLIQTLGLK